MNAVWILMTIFGSTIILLATICGTILVAMKLRHGSLSVKSREAQAEEAAAIQEIYQGLTQMEKRVESLETLLMERQQKEGEPHE